MIMLHSFSHIIAVSIQTPVSIRALPPNITADMKSAGQRAIMTCPITFEVEMLSLM
jgi:hypothetical protein